MMTLGEEFWATLRKTHRTTLRVSMKTALIEYKVSTSNEIQKTLINLTCRDAFCKLLLMVTSLKLESFHLFLRVFPAHILPLLQRAIGIRYLT